MAPLNKHQYWRKCLILLVLLVTYGCSTIPSKDSGNKQPYDNLYRGSKNNKTANEAAIAAETPEEAIKRGDVAYSKRQYDIALYEYVNALQLNGGDTETLNKVGDIHLTLGDFDSAEEAYNASVQLNESNQHALQGLGLIQLKLREFDQAKINLSKALELNPDLWSAYNGLGMIADIEGDYPVAIANYQRALDLNPRSAQVLNNLGYSEYLSGNWRAALMRYYQAVNSSPDYKRAWYNIGLLYTRQEEYKDAFDAFRNVLGTPQAYNDIGYLSMLDGHYDVAEKYFQKAVESSPSYYLKAHENIDRLGRLRERGPGNRFARHPTGTKPVASQTSSNQDTALVVDNEGKPVVKIAPLSSAGVEDITSGSVVAVTEKIFTDIPVKSPPDNGATQQSTLVEPSQTITTRDQAPEPEKRLTTEPQPPDKLPVPESPVDGSASTVSKQPDPVSTKSVPAPLPADDPGSDPGAMTASVTPVEDSATQATTGNSGSTGKSSTYSTQGEQADYRKALAMVRDGQFEEAAESFNIFLDNYPDSSYADNANYWIGETYYVIRDFEPALEIFTDLVEKFPDSPKVPDTRLKIGYIYYEQHDWPAAHEELSGIVSTYPDTEVAQLANARLMRMEDEGH